MKKPSKTNLLPATRQETLPVSGMVDFLAAVPAPQVWLANFTNERTRATYLKAVEEFASLLDVRSASDLARITQALENKCPIEAVQRSAGHSKISTTQMYDKREVHHRESASFVVQY